jgi:hypothetical protein
MLVTSGRNNDTQWFDYMPGFFSQVTRVEWDADTMFAALPDDTATFLLSRGYARAMTEAEIEAYTAPAPVKEDPPPKPRPKKGDQS